MRTLTVNEMNAVSGGAWWAIAGGVFGGVNTYAERSDDGDMSGADWAAVGVSVVMGAAGGGLLKKAYKEWKKK